MRHIYLACLTFLLLTIGTLQPLHAAHILKMAVGDPRESEQGHAAQVFAKYLEEHSKNKYDVRVFFSGELGDENRTIKDVHNGTIHFSVVGIANLVPFVKELGVLTLPYLFDSLEQVRIATQGPASELMNNYAREEGFHILTWTYSDFRHISNAVRPIKTLNDIKGLSVRVPKNAVILSTYKAFGADPLPIIWSDTFKALQEEVVEGQCYGYIGFKAMKFYEAHQKYITEVRYTYQLQPIITSKSFLKTLSAEDQKLILDAGKAAQEAAYTYQIENVAQAKEDLKALGVTIDVLEDEEKWKKTALDIVWPELAELVGGKQVINKFLKAAQKPQWQ